MTAWTLPALAALPLALALVARLHGGGLLIGAATGPGALALAVLWPAAYWVGRRGENNINGVAEWVSGCAAGCVVLAVLLWAGTDV